MSMLQRGTSQKICEVIEALLHDKGISKHKFYADCGISHSQFFNWKTGKSFPRIGKLEQIADYLGVSLAYFAERTLPQ